MYIDQPRDKAITNLNADVVDIQRTNANDILNVYRMINQSNKTSDSVKKIQSEILINSYCKNKIIFNNRNLYLKIGSITNNPTRIYTTFNDLNTLMAIIFSKDISLEEKYQMFDDICSNYELSCDKCLQTSQNEDTLKTLYSDINDNFYEAIKLIVDDFEINISNQLIKTKQNSYFEASRKTS